MLIAYQSLNSNSSKTHNLAASTMQRFTRDANAYVTGARHDALVLPHNAMDLTTPIQGPANLVPIAELPEKSKKRKLDDAGAAGSDNKRRRLGGADGGTANVFGAQVSLLWQNFYRTFGQMPDIMVCGEVDASHDDFKNMVGTKDGDDKTVLAVEPVIAKAANQSFTAISQTSGQITQISSGIGYVAYSVRSLNVVFVHVPNEFATEAVRVEEFYRKIASSLLQGGKVIHLVIGDTNQSSPDFTKKALNSAFGTDAYKNALTGSAVSPVDNWRNTQSGTNAKGTKLYDVAVYRSDVVELLKPVAYVSQSANAITVTDHYGLAVMTGPKGSKAGV